MTSTLSELSHYGHSKRPACGERPFILKNTSRNQNNVGNSVEVLGLAFKYPYSYTLALQTPPQIYYNSL